MKNKRPRKGVVLAIGLLLAAARTADLLFFSEPITGFAAAGSVWLRYIPWLAALFLPYAVSRRAAAQPLALQEKNPPLGVAMLLTAALLLAAGLTSVPLALTYGAISAWLDSVAPVLAGLWLLVYGVRACMGFGMQRRLHSAWFGAVLPLYFLWRLVWRFQFVPAALARLPATLRVLSAVAALLFAAVLLKIFLVPGLPCGHTLYAAGSAAFYLCAALELPQTVYDAAAGTLTVSALLTGLAFGAFGLCGLLCAWAACGPDATDEA